MEKLFKCFLFSCLLLVCGAVHAADPANPNDSDWLPAMMEQIDQGRYTEALTDAFASGATPDEVLDVWTSLGYSEELLMAKISENPDGALECVPCIQRCCGSPIEREKFCQNCRKVWCKKRNPKPCFCD
jgi:hypothetical protein